MFKKILLPVDLAEPDLVRRAANTAEALANSADADIRIVNVQSVVQVAFLDYVPNDFTEEVKRGLESELAAIRGAIKRPSGRVSSALLFGPIHQKILEEAKEWGSDLIVVCSHRPGMERFLIGSNASAIVKNAECSVLVLR